MADWQTFVPYLVSEREAGGWEDCTFASGVMLGNAFEAANAHPATRAEYEALRAATGYLHAEPAAGEKKGGSIDDLMVALRRRYGLGGQKATSWAEIEEQWQPGAVMALQGMNGKLPTKARGGSTYTGPHAIFCQWKLTTGTTVVLNPLAANGSAPVGVAISDLKAFFGALGGAAALMGFVGQELRRNPMDTFDLERWQAPAGTAIYEYPGGPKVTAYGEAKEITTLGIPMDRVADKTPFLIGGWRSVIFTSRAVDGVLGKKRGYVRTDALVKLASDPEWDTRVLATIYDPTKIGEVIVKTVPDQAQLDVEFNAGIAAAQAAIAPVVTQVATAAKAAADAVRR